jgi:hypothetical protein
MWLSFLSIKISIFISKQLPSPKSCHNSRLHPTHIHYGSPDCDSAMSRTTEVSCVRFEVVHFTVHLPDHICLIEVVASEDFNETCVSHNG